MRHASAAKRNNAPEKSRRMQKDRRDMPSGIVVQVKVSTGLRNKSAEELPAAYACRLLRASQMDEAQRAVAHRTH